MISTDTARSADNPAGAGLRMTFHHVGVAVRSIERALEYYEGVFGFERVGEPVEVPHEEVRVCFVRVPPGTLIELVEGLTDDSVVHRILERPGGGTYHICYEVGDMDEAIRTLRRARCFPFRKFDMGLPNGRRFAFLLNPDRQLFELCEAGTGDGDEA